MGWGGVEQSYRVAQQDWPCHGYAVCSGAAVSSSIMGGGMPPWGPRLLHWRMWVLAWHPTVARGEAYTGRAAAGVAAGVATQKAELEPYLSAEAGPPLG